jgi:hypothetical protein
MWSLAWLWRLLHHDLISAWTVLSANFFRGYIWCIIWAIMAFCCRSSYSPQNHGDARKIGGDLLEFVFLPLLERIVVSCTQHRKRSGRWRTDGRLLPYHDPMVSVDYSWKNLRYDFHLPIVWQRRCLWWFRIHRRPKVRVRFCRFAPHCRTGDSSGGRNTEPLLLMRRTHPRDRCSICRGVLHLIRRCIYVFRALGGV